MTHSPILSLPHELLIKVLSYVVGFRPPGVCLWNMGKDASHWCGPRRMPTDRYSAMLLVCRKFYYAGIEAYYGAVIFKFLSTDHLRAMLSGLGMDRKGCIRRITVNVEFEIDTNIGEDGFKKPLYLPRTAQDLSTDPLAELPSLQKAKIMVGATCDPATDTERAMHEIEHNIRNAWRSKAETIEIEWFWREHS